MRSLLLAGVLIAAGFASESLNAESLDYVVNWPSGLSAGEVTLNSTGLHEQNGTVSTHSWSFDLDVDAGVPGFAIRDMYRATAVGDFCSQQLEKTTSHGKRKTEERISFDPQKTTVTRETLHGGGKTEIQVSPCARDPLTFLQFARHEIAQGRMPPQQAVVFGAVYQVRMVYSGTQAVTVGSKKVDADRVQTNIKGPSSDLTVDLYFARDAARTPVLMRIPLPLAAFTVELMR